MTDNDRRDTGPVLDFQYNKKPVLSFEDWMDDVLLPGCVPLKYRNEHWFSRKDLLSALNGWFTFTCGDTPAKRRAAFERVLNLARARDPEPFRL